MNKENILKVCQSILLKQKESLLNAQKEIEESMLSETKSSLGDKHETARAKMQTEQEKLSKQQSDLNKLIALLGRIDPFHLSKNCDFGALVFTDKTTFFLAVGLGKIEIDNQQLMVISTHSPIAQLMIDLKVNDTYEFNGLSYKIINIA